MGGGPDGAKQVSGCARVRLDSCSCILNMPLFVLPGGENMSFVVFRHCVPHLSTWIGDTTKYCGVQ